MLKKRGYADLKDGLQMYYETMGSGDPVIFLHQSWLSNFEFQKVLPIFAKKHQIFSPDTLGFGFSPPAPWDWEFQDFCDSFIDFMNFMDIEKACFTGSHTGSKILTNLAARYPKRVDKIAPYGLGIYTKKIRKEKYARRRMLGWNWGPYVKALKPGDVIGYEVGILQKKEDGSHLVEMWNEQKRENPDSKLEHIHKAVIANLLHYDKGGADALTVNLNYDPEQILPKVKAPCLVIMGTRDCLKPPIFKTQVHSASLMSGLVKHKLIYGAGILGWLDYPQEMAEAVLGFFEDPEGYVGTTGYELELAEKEYLFMVEDNLNH